MVREHVGGAEARRGAAGGRGARLQPVAAKCAIVTFALEFRRVAGRKHSHRNYPYYMNAWYDYTLKVREHAQSDRQKKKGTAVQTGPSQAAKLHEKWRPVGSRQTRLPQCTSRGRPSLHWCARGTPMYTC